MPPLASPVPPQEDLFRHQLTNLLDSQHELYRPPGANASSGLTLLYAERSGAARACRFAYLWACST
jgi:hypothetical protein